MQVDAKDVVVLAIPKIVQEQVQVGGDVGEAFVENANKIEAYLEKTILIKEKQENVVLTPMLEKENTNEDVEPHAQIDGGDILNFFNNLLPHPSSQMERLGEFFFFCQFFRYNTFINFAL
jgi:hypothetical protein